MLSQISPFFAKLSLFSSVFLVFFPCWAFRGQSAGQQCADSPSQQPPHHPHPKGDVDSHHGSRDSGQTCCHDSMHLGESQPANVWTNEQEGVGLEEGGSKYAAFILIRIST